MEHKITPRQLEALEAAYRFRNPHAHVVGPLDKRTAMMGGVRSRTGGARRRMVEDLERAGFITRYSRHDPNGDEWGHPTVKGYEALAPKAAKLGINLKELRDRQEARLKVENDRAEREAAKKADDRRRIEERAARERDKQIARFRQLFRDWNLTDAFEWPDQHVLDFAEQAGDAIHAF